MVTLVALPSLSKLDPIPPSAQKLGSDIYQWFSTTVDTTNEAIGQLQLYLANVELRLSNIKFGVTGNIGGAGAGPISVAVTGMTASSPIVATIASSSLVVAVAKCIGTATGFDVTFTGNPGASCILNYAVGLVSQ